MLDLVPAHRQQRHLLAQVLHFELLRLDVGLLLVDPLNDSTRTFEFFRCLDLHLLILHAYERVFFAHALRTAGYGVVIIVKDDLNFVFFFNDLSWLLFDDLFVRGCVHSLRNVDIVSLPLVSRNKLVRVVEVVGKFIVLVILQIAAFTLLFFDQFHVKRRLAIPFALFVRP